MQKEIRSNELENSTLSILHVIIKQIIECLEYKLFSPY